MRFRHLLRRLLRAPGFTAAAIGTLALAIGANVAIFSVVQAVILRPLPYPTADRLVAVNYAVPGAKLANANGAPFLAYSLIEDGHAFDAIAWYSPDTLTITGLARPERADVLSATHALLPMLGVQPALGRLFTPADDVPGATNPVILSWDYWQTHFGGSPDIIGRHLVGDAVSREIVGVLPRGFRFLDIKADLYLPVPHSRAQIRLGQFGTPTIGRLRPGVTLGQAISEARALVPSALHKFPLRPGASLASYERAGITPIFQPIADSLSGGSRRFLFTLMGILGIVLLIACANIANLTLVRTDSRRHEFAVRAALGADSGRIFAELAAESFLLAVCGGIAGLGLAAFALRLLSGAGPASLPRLSEASLDTPVLCFSLGITLLAGLLFGALPALSHARLGNVAGLRENDRSGGHSRESSRARSALIVLQVALALVLTIGAGLLVRTLSALGRVPPGFTRPEAIQIFRIAIPTAQVKDDEAAIRVQHDILNRIAALPGVRSAALISNQPMTPAGWSDPIYTEGQSLESGQIPPLTRYRFASPGLPATMGTALLAGRDLTWDDVYGKRSFVLVNESFARANWGTAAEAPGRRLRETPVGSWREVAGVVADERSDGLDKPAPQAVYFPVLMADFHRNPVFTFREPAIVVRAEAAGSATFIEGLRKAVWSVDPDIPLAEIHTVAALRDRSNARVSFTFAMLSLSGVMALFLGLVGVYGVISYSVALRKREIGIRSALGALPTDLARAFASQGMALTVAGIILGAAAAWPLTRFLESMLFGVTPADPGAWVVAVAGLFSAAAAASWIPARRAARVDPSGALRAE